MMYTENLFRDLHSAMAHAQYEGLSDIQYEERDYEAIRNAKTAEERAAALHTGIPATRRPTQRDFGVYTMFQQTWGSTALGHGGMGGAAVTTAYTIVIECYNTQEWLVYFGGMFCYKVSMSSPNRLTFVEDCANHCLESKRKSGKYM